MGLDITAYKGLKEAVGNEAFDETGELIDGEFVQFYLESNFPGRADEIKDMHAYKAEDSSGFCAGSYGGYNRWRELLAEIAGYAETEYDSRPSHAATVWNNPEPGPFMELICFSDCEGVIGTAVSKKLASDFSEFQAKVDAHDNEGFKALYKEWKEAFEFASDSGCVKFH